MKPYFLALPLIAVLGAACAGLDGTGAGETPVPYEQTFVACEGAADPQACRDAANATRQAARPTEVPADPAVREIFLADTVVGQLIGAGEERKDFWLIIDSLGPDPPHGDEGGMVVAVFQQPVSYTGPVPTRSDPCKGRSGPDERVDPDDPCLDHPREYGTTHTSFERVRVVHAQVDTGRGEVVWLFPDDASDDIVEDMIRWAEETQYPATPGP